MNAIDSFEVGFYNEVNVRDLDEKVYQSTYKDVSGRINRSEVQNENTHEVYPDRSPIFNYLNDCKSKETYLPSKLRSKLNISRNPSDENKNEKKVNLKMEPRISESPEQFYTSYQSQGRKDRVNFIYYNIHKSLKKTFISILKICFSILY